MSKSRNDSNRQRSSNQDGLRHRPPEQRKRAMNDHQLTRRVFERFNDSSMDWDELKEQA